MFRTFCRGLLHAIGMFGMETLTDGEKIDGAEKRAWFSVREVTMAAILAGSIAVPAGFWFAGFTALPLAVIGGAVLFLPLFVFLPRLIRSAMKAGTDAVLSAFGKNEQTQKGLPGLLCRVRRPRAGAGGGPGDGGDGR